MKTQVSIPHHHYPANVREMVEEKLQNLAKFYDRIVSMRAVLERQKETHEVEIVANVGRGMTLVAEAQADLLNNAVDLAVDRMGKILQRHKTKLEERNRKGGRTGH